MDDVRTVEAVSKKASAAEEKGEYDAAFRLYVDAADRFLTLIRQSSSTSASARKKLTAEAQRCLLRAEKIKALKKDLKPLTKSIFDLCPFSFPS